MLTILTIVLDQPHVAATLAPTSLTPTVNRRFFLSTAPNNLTLSSPGDATPQSLTFAGRPMVFAYQPILLPPPSATIAGTLTFSIWLSSNSTRSVRVLLQGVFHESLPSGSLNFPSSLQNATVTRVPAPASVTLPIVSQPLFFESQISVSINATHAGSANTSITLSWGSTQTPSSVLVPMSGYDALANPIQIQNWAQFPTTSFNVSASYPTNVVYFLAQVIFTFPEDILNGRVNLTVVDTRLNPVNLATNLSMARSQGVSPTTFTYTTDWFYPNNSTTGVYQINVDVIDSQSNVALSLREIASFSLTRPNPLLTTTLNLLPYAAVGGVGIVAGVVFYRRRKTRSYLVPFDHFNTLTGGELAGGTVMAVEGNTGSGKSLLSQQMMYEDLRKGEPCVFVTTGDFPSNIRTGMNAMNLDVTGYEQNGLLTFVDSYSAEAGRESPEKYFVSSMGDLTSLGMKISSSLPSTPKGTNLYFDSLMPLASKAKPESIISFVQSIGARVRGIGGKAVFTFGPSMDGIVQRQLEEMADCVVQMEAFEERGLRRRRLRITKLRSRPHVEGWVLFGIEAGRGIIFYSKKPGS